MGNNLFSQEKKNLFTDMKRIRLIPEFTYQDIVLIHVEWDNELIMSSYNKSYEFDNSVRGREYNDFFDMSWEPYYGEQALYRTKIHRAYLKASKDFFSMTLGRQQIRFGSGKLWNPLDILNPVSPTFIEGPEDQKGTDALMLNFYCNEKTELAIIFDPKLVSNNFHDITAEGNNYVLRLRTTVVNTDIALMGGWVAKRGVGGVDLASVVADGMLRGCVMFHYPQEFHWFFQANLGYEYTFKEGVSLLAEYFYNGIGLNFNSEVKNAAAETYFFGMKQKNYYYLANQLITNNEHYLGIAIGYDFTPLLRGELFVIFDFQGYGMFMSPALKYNAMENLDLNFGILFGVELADSKYASDFKAFKEPFLYYLSLIYYF
jgi:hypothetical protein